MDGFIVIMSDFSECYKIGREGGKKTCDIAGRRDTLRTCGEDARAEG